MKFDLELEIDLSSPISSRKYSSQRPIVVISMS